MPLLRIAAEVPLLVDPRDTSRTCHRCGHCDKRNRPSRDDFTCLGCGFADHNAAINIGLRAVNHAADDAAWTVRPMHGEELQARSPGPRS